MRARLTQGRRGRRAAGGGAGLVSLVGAGPGNPDLLTLRAFQRLRDADVVYHDGLVPDAIVRIAARARRVSVARRAGVKTLTEQDVIDRLVASARDGRRVVRLKAGDPFVFGRGGEEVAALAEAGVPFEVVPGISAVTAAPALAGIPLTLRGVASSFVVVSGHASSAFSPVLGVLAPASTSIVVLMGLRERQAIAACLRQAGWQPSTPAAVVINASQPGQRVWRGRLGELGHDIGDLSPADAGVIVIGEVAAFWYRSAAHQRTPRRRTYGSLRRPQDVWTDAALVCR
jgi:uroporphyrin-III C-methyltransferase